MIKQIHLNVPHATCPSTVNLRESTGVREKMPPLSLLVNKALGERVATLSLVKVMRRISGSNREITHSYRGTSREARKNPAEVRVNGRKQTRAD
jgi:hypothetical protein